MPPVSQKDQQPWSVLRGFVRPRLPAERCELCGVALAAEHDHLLEPSARQLRCCCAACAILFEGGQDARYRRVVPRAEFLADFRLDDGVWDSLHLPINLAFFVRGAEASQVRAYFPSPAGAMESLLTLEAWGDLAAANPGLLELAPDVEALLVNRVGGAREHYRVSIDECYKLIGLIRLHWRGFSGGTEAQEQIGRFFDDLKGRSRPIGGVPDAGPGL